MIKNKVGQYYYAPRRKWFAIYQTTFVGNGVTTARPTGEEYATREEAKKRVYELNGWNFKN